MKSFRWRLAGIGALTSGLVLLVFGSVVGGMLYRDRIHTVDEELKSFGQLIAGRSGRNIDGQKVNESLLRSFGADRQPGLKIIDGQKYVLHESAWPAGLSFTDYPHSSTIMDPQPVLPKPKRNADGKLPPKRLQTEPVFYTVQVSGGALRIAVFSNEQIILYLAQDLSRVQAEVRRLGLAFAIALPGALLIIAVGSALLARKALRPIDVLSGRMESLSAKGLDQRLEMTDADREFTRIITAFNDMMARLEKSFTQANRFSADASHELKTPLAVLQGTIERARAECPENDPGQARLAEMQEEVSRLVQILESLLLLSRADAGKLQLSQERFNAGAWLQPLLEDLGMMCEAKDIALESENAFENEIEADPVLMQQVIMNLFTNAVKYNVEGGRVVCTLVQRQGEGFELAVRNTGPELSEEQVAQLFDRFYQADPAHGEGNGLGLSIAREIVEAHRGHLTFERKDGMNRFIVTLPVR